MACREVALGIVRGIGTIGLGSFAAIGTASAADSLCASHEEVFFNCQIKDSTKLLSACGRVPRKLHAARMYRELTCNTVLVRATSRNWFFRKQGRVHSTSSDVQGNAPQQQR